MRCVMINDTRATIYKQTKNKQKEKAHCCCHVIRKIRFSFV